MVAVDLDESGDFLNQFSVFGLLSIGTFTPCTVRQLSSHIVVCRQASGCSSSLEGCTVFPDGTATGVQKGQGSWSQHLDFV